jgi:hypothetical protein
MASPGTARMASTAPRTSIRGEEPSAWAAGVCSAKRTVARWASAAIVSARANT